MIAVNDVSPGGQKNALFNKDATARSSLELLYHVSRELASTLELRKALPRILFLSLDNVGGISGSIIVLDDKGQPVESAIIHTRQVYDQTTRQLRVTLEKGLAGWVVSKRQPVLIPNTSRDERWLQRPDDAPDRTGPKSAISVPLLVQDRLVGVLTLVHPEPGFFTEEHLALVQAIADQAGITVLNAHLYEESQRQARIMSALADSAAAINVSLRLDDVLQRILEQTSLALRVEATSLALTIPNTDLLEFRAATGLAAQEIIGMRLKLGHGVAGWVAREGRPVIVPQVQRDPHFYPEVDRRTGFETRAIACAPILSQGKVIGVVEAFNPTEGPFNADTLLYLTGIGSLAGTAIRHAHLFEWLESAHQRYRDLFEENIDPILLTNWQGHIREVNRRAVLMTGYSKEDLQEMAIDQLHQIDTAILGVDFNNLSEGATISYESVLHTRAGGGIPVEVYVHPVSIEDVHRLQWIFRDLSERKNLEILREDLTSMVYHDLRAPLANLAYSLEAMDVLLAGAENAELQSVLDVANRSVERIQRLISSLLDIQSLEAGQELTNKVTLAVSKLIADALETIRPLAEGKNQEIQVDQPDSLPPVSVDEDMIRRVLVNLLDNAVKFNPLDSQIRLGVEQEDDRIKIWVEDRGPGIQPDETEKIFNKFERLRSQTQGIGLGLAFCRLAVEAHQGRIWVDSIPGEGSRFTFTLPVEPGEGEPDR